MIQGQLSVNVETAEAVGTTILSSMKGKTVLEHSFKKNNHVVTMATKTTIKTDDALVQIDPLLLFQRLTIATKTSTNSEDIV